MLTKLAAGLPDSTEKIPTIKEMPITQEVTGITNQIRFALNRSARPTHVLCTYRCPPLLTTMALAADYLYAS